MSCCKPHGIENCDPVKVCEYEKEDGDERENSIMLSAELGVKDIHQYDLLRGFEDFKNDGFFNEEDPAFDVIAAVYVFYDHTKEVPLYVGESTRINGRLFEDHLKGHTTSIAHNLFLHFRHVKIYHLSEFDVAHRHLLEQMIIFKEKPLYNTWIMKMFSEQQFLSVLKTLKTRENWPDATTSELAAFESLFPRNYAKYNQWEKNYGIKKNEALKKAKEEWDRLGKVAEKLREKN